MLRSYLGSSGIMYFFISTNRLPHIHPLTITPGFCQFEISVEFIIVQRRWQFFRWDDFRVCNFNFSVEKNGDLYRIEKLPWV